MARPERGYDSRGVAHGKRRALTAKELSGLSGATRSSQLRRGVLQLELGLHLVEIGEVFEAGFVGELVEGQEGSVVEHQVAADDEAEAPLERGLALLGVVGEIDEELAGRRRCSAARGAGRVRARGDRCSRQ